MERKKKEITERRERGKDHKLCKCYKKILYNFIMFNNHIYYNNFCNLNKFCIPESFNTNISHQLFKYTITFVNIQRENTNSKGDLLLKTRFETVILKIFGVRK